MLTSQPSPATSPANRTGCSAAGATLAAAPPAAGVKPFNDGIRVFWCSGGDLVFRDHEGRKRPLTIINLRRIVSALHREAVQASVDRRQSDLVALSTIKAEAETAISDAIKWRCQARGIFLVSERVMIGGEA